MSRPTNPHPVKPTSPRPHPDPQRPKPTKALDRPGLHLPVAALAEGGRGGR